MALAEQHFSVMGVLFLWAQKFGGRVRHCSGGVCAIAIRPAIASRPNWGGRGKLHVTRPGKSDGSGGFEHSLVHASIQGRFKIGDAAKQTNPLFLILIQILSQIHSNQA